MLRDIYAKNFSEIQQRYRSALSKVKDVDAKFRLEMIGDNLKVLHWNLRQNKLLGPTTPLYFYVPEDTKVFQLSLETSAPGETAVASLSDPSGQQVANFNCTQLSVDRQEIKASAAQMGWWKLEIRKAQTGALDDVWVKLESPVSGYWSPDPQRAVGVR